MSQELMFTSAPRGIRTGNKGGFCTVAATRSLSAPWIERLEMLSGYKAAFDVSDSRIATSPINWAHWRVSVGGQTRSVLSRVGFAGYDHTRRSNMFAHHLVLEPSEHIGAGPAWVMLQQGVMETAWSGEPRIIEQGRAMPVGNQPPRPCEAWKLAAGDAGWAGVLAERFRADPARPAFILFQPEADLLSLMDEAIALLPGLMRWQVTFSTYFDRLQPQMSCAWRCCLIGSPAAAAAKQAPNALLIDLSRPSQVKERTPYVEMARTGEPVTQASPKLVSVGARVGADDLDGDLQEAIEEIDLGPTPRRHLSRNTASQEEFTTPTPLPAQLGSRSGFKRWFPVGAAAGLLIGSALGVTGSMTWSRIGPVSIADMDAANSETELKAARELSKENEQTIATLRGQIKTAQDGVDRRTKELENEKRSLEDKLAAAKGEASRAKEAHRAIADQLEEVKRTQADQRKQQETSGATGENAYSGKGGPQTNESPQRIISQEKFASVQFVELPRRKGSGALLESDATAITSELEISFAGVALMHLRKGGEKPGPAEWKVDNKTVASFKFNNDSLTVTYEPDIDDDTIEQMRRDAALLIETKVAGKEEVHLVRFAQPARLDVRVNRTTTIDLTPNLPNYVNTQKPLRLDFVASPTTWKAEPTSGSEIKFTHTDLAEFIVSINDRSVKCNWGDQRDAAQMEVAAAVEHQRTQKTAQQVSEAVRRREAAEKKFKAMDFLREFEVNVVASNDEPVLKLIVRRGA